MARFRATLRETGFVFCPCERPFDAAIAGSSRTRLRRGLRLSSATTALPPAVNASPSGLPPRSRKRHAVVSEAVPPPGARSSIRAIVADLSLSRYSQPSGPISRSLKSAQVFVSVLSGTQTAQATSVCFPVATGQTAPPGKALSRFKPRERAPRGPNSMNAAGSFSLAMSKCPPGRSTAPSPREPVGLNHERASWLRPSNRSVTDATTRDASRSTSSARGGASWRSSTRPPPSAQTASIWGSRLGSLDPDILVRSTTASRVCGFLARQGRPCQVRGMIADRDQ